MSVAACFIWILPVIKHFRKRYFYYFLLVAVNSIIKYLAADNSKEIVNYDLVITFLMLLAVQRGEKFPKSILYALPFSAGLFILPGYLTHRMTDAIVTLLNIIVFSILIKNAIENISEREGIGIFYPALLLYQAVTVCVYFTDISNIGASIYYPDIVNFITVICALIVSLYDDYSFEFFIRINKEENK